MNGLKSGISIILVIIAVVTILIFSINQQEINQEEKSDMKNPAEVEKLLDEIRDTKIQNEQSENPFVPQTPKWTNESGPFKIDDDEYWLGQKVFVNIGGLSVNDKGSIDTLMPVTNQNYMILYSSMKFDGSENLRNNYYFTPKLSAFNAICNSDQLLGDWVMKFKGTQYPDLVFTVVDKMMPGYADKYETIKNIGNC